jgi:hypothetical protein
MKIKYILFIGLFGHVILPARSQSYDIEQLLLDYQKLTELKGILSELKTGYQVLSTGYEQIRSISASSFNLHNTFLSGLLALNPAVANYKKVQDIIGFQSSISSEYQSAYTRFKQDKHFTPDEISYLGTVYSNLFSRSLADINNLTTVLTPDTLRMSDDERLHAVDGIYETSHNELLFLRSFNNSTTMLAIDRATEQNDAQSARKLYGLE